MALVGFNEAVYTVSEGESSVTLTIEVKNSPHGECLINFPIDINLARIGTLFTTLHNQHVNDVIELLCMHV